MLWNSSLIQALTCVLTRQNPTPSVTIQKYCNNDELWLYFKSTCRTFPWFSFFCCNTAGGCLYNDAVPRGSQGGRGGRLRLTDTVVISPATHHPRGRNCFWVCNIENLSSSSWSSSSSSSSKSSSSSNLSPCIKDGENVKPQQKERNSIGEPVCVDCNSHSLLSLLANSFYRAIIIWRGADEEVGKRRHCRAPYREVIVSNNDSITNSSCSTFFSSSFTTI